MRSRGSEHRCFYLSLICCTAWRFGVLVGLYWDSCEFGGLCDTWCIGVFLMYYHNIFFTRLRATTLRA